MEEVRSRRLVLVSCPEISRSRSRSGSNGYSITVAVVAVATRFCRSIGRICSIAVE